MALEVQKSTISKTKTMTSVLPRIIPARTAKGKGIIPKLADQKANLEARVNLEEVKQNLQLGRSRVGQQRLLINPVGLILDYKTKGIESIDGSPVKCTGSTVFKVEYQGHEANVLALVTPSTHEEIILSRKTLQKLTVLPNNFPMAWKKSKVSKATIESSNKDKHFQEATEGVLSDKEVTTAKILIEDSNLQDDVQKLKDKYGEVFNNKGELKPMLGEPYAIERRDDIPVKPIHVNVPRRTPYALQPAGKAKIDHLERLGILKKVKGSSEWVSPSSFVPKPDGDVRLVSDLVHLNRFVKRPIHPFKPTKDILAIIDPKAKYFATFDAKAGYWQIMLDEKSQALKTIITEWGLY